LFVVGEHGIQIQQPSFILKQPCPSVPPVRRLVRRSLGVGGSLGEVGSVVQFRFSRI
jgi:hypothetical protein